MTFRTPRLLVLTGGCNLRDLGGHGAADGREVVRGLLYRSGVLSYLTPSDHNALARLKLRTVVDLRRPDEIAAEPTEWPVPVRTLSFPEHPQHGPGQRDAPWEKSSTEAEARAWMAQSYVTMHEWLASQLRAIFQAILERELPLLFHCAAGKDRTGFCAGVVLSLLGVSEETILDEFAFTDEAVDLHGFTKRLRTAGMGVTDTDHPIDRMDAGVRRALLSADRDYLKSALDRIVEVHGSVEAYVTGAIGLTPAEIMDIRELLLDD
jgi:protein-tyrosine phosphatase